MRCQETLTSARNTPRNARQPGGWPRNTSSRFPKDRYQTEVESWRELQSQNIEFTMKRLREPIEAGDWTAASEHRHSVRTASADEEVGA
jgi:hypothetical protein